MGALDFRTPNVTLRGASGNREKCIITGTTMTDTSAANTGIAIKIEANNITIANVTVCNVYFHDIQFPDAVSANNADIYNCWLKDSGEMHIKSSQACTGVYCDNNIVEWSRLSYTTTAATTPYGSCSTFPCYYYDAIDVHAGNNWIVRHNWFVDEYPVPGDWANMDGMTNPAILFWNGCENPLVDSNVFINCSSGVAFGLNQNSGCFTGGGSYRTTDNSHGGIIRNNFFYRDPALTGDVAIYVCGAPNVTVVGNTIIQPDEGTTAHGGDDMETNYNNTKNAYIVNNLCCLTPVVNRSGCANCTEFNNITGATLGWLVNGGANITITGDCHLVASDTLAIDQGFPLAGWDDFDIFGNSRPQTCSCACYDIGANEYICGTSTPTYTRTMTYTPTMTSTPAPTSTATLTPAPPTQTSTITLTSSQTCTVSQTYTATETGTPVTGTPTSTSTASGTPTFTSTITPTQLPFTATPLSSSTPTTTFTPTFTPTAYMSLSIIKLLTYPNPVKNQNSLNFYINLSDIPDRIDIKVYTTAARLIRVMNSAQTKAPNGVTLVEDIYNECTFAYSIPYDLTDWEGNWLADGMYYFVVEARKSDTTVRGIGRFTILK